MHTSCMFKYVSLQACVNPSHRFLTAFANAPDSSLVFLRSDLFLHTNTVSVALTSQASFSGRMHLSPCWSRIAGHTHFLFTRHHSSRCLVRKNLTYKSVSRKSLDPNPVKAEEWAQLICGRRVPSQCVRYVKVFTGLKCASSSLS